MMTTARHTVQCEGASGSVERRLAQLERSNRRLRRGLVAAGLVAAALAATGFAPNQPAGSKEFQTERLIIKGADGQPRMMMQGDGSGSSLFLYGPDKYRQEGGGGGGDSGVGGFSLLRPRMRLQVTDAYSHIQMLDPDGRERIIVRLDAEGPSVKTLDEKGDEIE